MASLSMTTPDVFTVQPSLVLLLWDEFTGTNMLAGDVTVEISNTNPPLQNAPAAQFVFANLANGSYTVNVQSTPDQPYYLPVNIPVTLPFERPEDSLWNPQPVWPGYPDIVLADPNKTLTDPGQTPAYLGQRTLATLAPTTAYPFPAGATLVRGAVTAAGVALSGALVTTAPVAQPGQFPVVVVNPTGATSAAQSLAVVHAPVIDSLDPPTVIAGSPAFTLTAEGSGFAAGAVLKWNGAALPTDFLSSGGLTAPVTAAQVAGAAQIAVVAVNPDGTTSNPQTLTVAAAPAISSIDPPSVTAGSPAFQLSVYGTGFASAAVVELNGAALATTWVSSTQLEAQVTAAQVAAAAQLNIVALNPGPPPQSSNTETLAVVSAPVINSLEPGAVVAGSAAFGLTVNGSGFASGAIAKLGTTALPTEVLGATELTAQLTAAQVQSVAQLSITVSNPSGPASNAQTLAVVAAPAITSLDPGTVSAGSAAFTLVVRGSGFASGSVVELNGTTLATTFVNSTELDALVPRSGYTTGADGTYVLFFDNVGGSGETVTLIVSHPSYPNPKSISVAVLRGATVTANIDMST
jgi:IPT/TIG domain